MNPEAPLRTCRSCGRADAQHCPHCRACIAADHWCDVPGAPQPAARVLLRRLRDMPAVTADLHHVQDAPACDNDYSHESVARLEVQGRVVRTFCEPCGLRFVAWSPNNAPLDVAVLAVVPVPVRAA